MDTAVSPTKNPRPHSTLKVRPPAQSQLFSLREFSLDKTKEPQDSLCKNSIDTAR